MFKKNLNILLLLLLAVFSIGLFSTSYAVTTDFMENYMTFVNQEIPTTRGGYMVSQFSGQKWQLFKEKYGTICESYDYFLFLFPSSATQGFRVLLWNDNENTGYWDKEYNGQQIGVTETLSVKEIFVPYDATKVNHLTDSTRDLPWLPAYASMNIAYYGFYIGDKKVYTNSNLNVVSTKNWVYSNNYSDDKFEFSPTSTNFEICSINGLVQPSEVYVYERTTQNYLTLGYLEKFSNLDNISITRYRYTKSNGWVETSDWATDNFEGYNVQDDILTYTIDVSKISADTLVLFNFTPNNIVDFTNQTFALYVKSPYTYISNGVIYPAQTFSGDYYNNYNDDSNTDKIVDNSTNDTENITDTLTDTSEVDSQLNEFLSGDLANNLGYTPLENPFSSFLYNILTGICNTLLGSGDVTLYLDLHGHQIEMKSSDFFLPSGAFKTFLSTSLVVAYIYMLYKYFYHIIIKLETADIKHIQDDFSSHDSDLF